MELPADSKTIDVHEKSDASSAQWVPPEEWVLRLIDEYSGRHGGDTETLPPGSDVNRVAAAIFSMNEEESVKILKSLIESQQQDYTFDHVQMHHIKQLVEGNEACEMDHGEWAYETCKTAGLMHNWSPYAEVRAVTLPYDDPDEPCESFRAYVLGFFWVCVCTAVNTCEPLCWSRGWSLMADSQQFLALASQVYPFPTRLSSCFWSLWAAPWLFSSPIGVSPFVARATRSIRGRGRQKSSCSLQLFSLALHHMATSRAYW